MANPTSMQPSAPAADAGIIDWFCRNPVAAYVMLFILFACGIIAARLVPLETFPEYDPGIVRITVPYPGATPVEVEENVVKFIEESLIGTVGVARTVSASEQGLATIDVELDYSTDPIDTLNNIRTAVDRIEDFPPANADQPEVVRLQVQHKAVSIAVSSDTLNAFDLRTNAEALRDNLLLIPGIAVVELFGTPEQEVQVEVSEEVLRRHGLTFNSIVNAINSASINFSGGDLRTDSGDIVMSTLAKRAYAEEFADIPLIARPGGAFVRLGDVAELTDGLVEQNIAATLNGSPTVFLQVRVASGISPQEASSRVREFIDDYDTADNVSLLIWEDESLVIAESIGVVLQNGVFGLILVFLILLFVFDLRTSTWVALGVPVVFVGSLIAFPFLGLSINVITLFAFFILVPLVVDDSIIVAESINIARFEGLSDHQSAIDGVKRVLAPIILASLTSMAAFAALWPLHGLIGQMFTTIAVVVIIVMALALLESIFVLPGHLASARSVDVWPLSMMQRKVRGSLQRAIDARIVPMITFSVRRPLLPLAVVATLFLAAWFLVLLQIVRFNPSLNIVDDNNIQADIELPINARVEDLNAARDMVVAAARELNTAVGGDAIAGIAVSTGMQFPLDTYQGVDFGKYRDNVASVRLKLNHESARNVSVDELRYRWQEMLADTTWADSLTFPMRRSRPTERVSYSVIHSDPEVVQSAVAEIESAWAEFPGVLSVENSMDADNRRIDVKLNDAGHAAGLDAVGVATQLRNAFYGAEAQRIQRGREEVRVMVRYPAERRAGYAELRNERIHLPNGRQQRQQARPTNTITQRVQSEAKWPVNSQTAIVAPAANLQVPLHTIAEIVETRIPAARWRINGQNAAIATANLDVNASLSGDLAERSETEILPALQNRYPSLQIREHGMLKELRKVKDTLLISAPIAILVIFCLIASFLRSFIQPLLALAGVPMAFVGAVVGHWILGYELTITSLFGLIAVSGVVVNDTILLMHRYNLIRRQGEIPEVAAVSAATKQRARAILLTSLTTVFGLLPILFSNAETIQFLIPLVVSLTFGLIFAGIGLLLFLPSVLMMTELVKIRLGLA